MKKIILASVSLVAVAGAMNAQAVTASFCSGGAAAASAVTQASAATSFVKAPFTPKCSANVHLVGDDGTTYYRVGSGSTKGKNSFMGSTAGGAVMTSAACAATGCVATDASAAATSTSNPSS